MPGPAILRELRQLAGLPLRHETIYHLVFNSHAIDPPCLNRLIAADPALAVGLLRRVPFPVSEGKLGVAQVARVATPTVLFELAGRASIQPDGSLWAANPVVHRLWAHSVATAHAARHLSRQRTYQHPQAAFLAGLLHNLGLLAAATVVPAVVAEILDEAVCLGDALAAEQERLGATHLKIGRQLARRWSLPQWLHDVLWWHHQANHLPVDLADRALVELVAEAEALVARSEFALGRAADSQTSGPPARDADAAMAALVRGVRQATAFLGDHPLRDSSEDPSRLVARALEVVAENTLLHNDLDWRQRAWEKLATLPADATPVELTGLIAQTIADASGALAALCYVRSDDGSFAEGTLWCDESQPVSCPLEVGSDSKPHAAQVIARLRPTWQNRSCRTIDLSVRGENLAHVLLWVDDLDPAPNATLLQQAMELCVTWLTQAGYVARLEAQLESLTATLREQALQSVAQFEAAKLAALAEMAAGAGHEINNPLAVISGRAQLLLAEETDPRRRKSLETIVAQAQRIHRMIVDLMMFARPPAPQCTPASVAELVERAMATVKVEADERHIAVSVSVPPGLPQVSADVAQLSAALECILQNSLEAIEKDGTVELTAEPGPNSIVELRVRDNGPGISQDQRAHIFEPFYSGRAAGRGLGIGLSKAWRIVQLHGGEIQVESGPLGTTVIVRLPALVEVDAQRACA